REAPWAAGRACGAAAEGRRGGLTRMQRIDGVVVYSATDVAHFLECEHLAALDVLALGDEVLRGGRSALDDAADLYARKGEAHERAYLESLRAQGLEVVDVAH